MIAADLGRALLLASVPVSYALGVLTLSQLFGVAFGAGTLSVLFVVPESTLFVSLVDADRYVDGNALVNGSRAMSFTAGPGLVLGVGAVGGVIGSMVTGRLAARIGVGRAYLAGAILFPVPLVLVPLAGGPMPVILGLLFAAEFWSGFGVMVLNISPRFRMPDARA